MADIHDRGRALGARLLAPRSKGGKGLELVITASTGETYDNNTGAVIATVEDRPGSGLRVNYKARDIDGARVLASDYRLLVSPVRLDGSDMPTPSPANTVLFDGTRYQIVSIEPWNYAGVTCGYALQVRA